MADLADFDAEQVEPSRSFELLPKGWVEAMIVDSEAKETVTDGIEKRRISLTYEILDEKYKNRKLWHGLNLKNPSVQAVQISRGQLSSICRAVNVQKPGDSSALHNLPHMILVGQKINKQSGEMQNVINDWKPKGAVSPVMTSQPSKPAASAQPQLSQVPTTPKSAPWGKK